MVVAYVAQCECLGETDRWCLRVARVVGHVQVVPMEEHHGDDSIGIISCWERFHDGQTRSPSF
jgi:hypothetical protein